MPTSRHWCTRHRPRVWVRGQHVGDAVGSEHREDRDRTTTGCIRRSSPARPGFVGIPRPVLARGARHDRSRRARCRPASTATCWAAARGVELVGRDRVARFEPLDAAQARDVEQHAAPDDAAERGRDRVALRTRRSSRRRPGSRCTSARRRRRDTTRRCARPPSRGTRRRRSRPTPAGRVAGDSRRPRPCDAARATGCRPRSVTASLRPHDTTSPVRTRPAAAADPLRREEVQRAPLVVGAPPAPALRRREHLGRARLRDPRSLMTAAAGPGRCGCRARPARTR